MSTATRRTVCVLVVSAVLLLSSLPAVAAQSDDGDVNGDERSFSLTLDTAAGEPTRVTVRYTVWGETSPRPAEDLVLIHGWASDRFAFQPVMEQRDAARLLVDGRRVLALDLPGHGSSDRLPDGTAYSQDLFARAVTALMDAEHSSSAVLLGHSNGTPVARLASSRDDRVTGLIAVDGQVVPVATAEMMAPMLERLSAEPVATAEALVRGMTSIVPDAIEGQVVDQLVAMTGQVDPRALIETLRSSVDPASWPDAEINVPVLLLLAQQPTWNDAYRERVDEIARRSTWIVWAGATHFLQLQRPGDFAQAVHGWLAERAR